jgi:hypothetical protein
MSFSEKPEKLEYPLSLWIVENCRKFWSYELPINSL